MADDMVDAAGRSFARWRESGDAAALAAVYDETAPQLLRVALHLVRHPAHAEDLLQATFVAAIERAGSYDPQRPLLGWLVGILHNQARWLLRREGREPDPLRLPPARVRDPIEQVEAAEFTAQIDDAIARLPAAYQPVLRLHLRLQLSAVDIAHALDRPAGTVRSQIVRGLELLRQRLGSHSGSGAGSAAFAAFAVGGTRGLAAVRTAVLAHGSQVATAATAGAIGLVGGALVMKKIVFAVLALALLAFGWWMQQPASQLPPSSEGPTAAAIADPGRTAASEVDEPARTAVALPAADAAGGWWLEGHVRGTNGALAGAEVRLQITIDYEACAAAASVSDAAGYFAFPLEMLRALPPIDLDRAELELVAWAPAHAQSRVHVKLPHRELARPLHVVQDLELAPGRSIMGRVIAENGAAVAGADVDIQVVGGSEANKLSASTDSSGTYRLALGAAASLEVHAAHPRWGNATLALAPAALGDVTAPELVLRPAPLVAARLVFDDGSPATGLDVQLVVPIDAGTLRTVAATTTDADGRFAVRSLPLGRYRLRIDSFSRCRDWPELGADLPEPTIRLVGMHLIRLSFCDAQGRRLHAFGGGWSEFDGDHDADLRAAAAGRVALDDLPHGRRGGGSLGARLLAEGHWLWIQTSHGAASGEALLQAAPPGYVHDLELRLVEHPRTASLRIVVHRADDDVALPCRASLSQRFLDEPALAAEPETTPEGLLLQANPGRFEVRIAPRPHGNDLGEFAAFTRPVELRAGAVTELVEAIEPGGRVRLCVHLPTPAAGPIADFAVDCPALPEGVRRTNFISTLPDGWMTTSQVLPDAPVQWQPLLPPGHRELRIRARDYEDLTLGVVVRAREITDVDVYLQARR